MSAEPMRYDQHPIYSVKTGTSAPGGTSATGQPRQRPVRDRDATFLRFLIQVPAGQSPEPREVERAVRAELGPDATAAQWTVRRLFRSPSAAGDEELARFFEADGKVVSSPVYPLQKLAFEMARELARETGWVVWPDLPSSAYAGGPRALLGEGRREALAAVRDSGNQHLPGAEDPNWSHAAIGTFGAWALDPPSGKTMGEGIVIGHPDTGYTDHPELEPGCMDSAKGWDVVDDDRDAHDPLQKRWWSPLDTPGHGTGPASTIVGRAEGAIKGVAPKATLVPIRTVRSVVQVFDGDVAKAIDHARHQRCHVISMSLGGVGFFPALGVALQRAIDDGIIVMAAAGNHVGFVTAPASYPECLAVAATNVLSKPWSGSCHGREVDVAAPGEDVAAASVRWDKRPVFSVGRHFGTTFGVAHLAGVAALWLAYHGRDQLIRTYGAPNIQRLFLLTLRRHGCRVPPGWDSSEYGAGIVDAEAMLRAPLPERLPAAAARDVAAPSPELQRIASLAPGFEVRDVLAPVLGTTPAAVQDELALYGGEIAYLLSEDPDVRAALLQPQPAGEAARALQAGTSTLQAILARVASPSLALRLSS